MESTGDELPIGAIVRRLERLERESRRWKVVAMLTTATLGMILLIGADKNGATSVPRELQAGAFVLVDREGTPLGRLGLLPHGAWGLGLYDQGEKSRIVLSMEGDGWPFLQRLDRAGKDRVRLRSTEVHATATGELIKRPGPSRLFFDQEAAVVWHAP